MTALPGKAPVPMVPPIAPADRAPIAHLMRFPAAAATGLASSRMAAAGIARPPRPCPRRYSSSPRRWPRLPGAPPRRRRCRRRPRSACNPRTAARRSRPRRRARTPARCPGSGSCRPSGPAARSVWPGAGPRHGPGRPRQRREAIRLGDEPGVRHPVQDGVDADGEVPGPVHAGLAEGRVLVRAGQAARDDRAALARHPGGGLVHPGYQPALLPVALTRPDHRHRPLLAWPGGFLRGRPFLQTSWPGQRRWRKGCSPGACEPPGGNVPGTAGAYRRVSDTVSGGCPVERRPRPVTAWALAPGSSAITLAQPGPGAAVLSQASPVLLPRPRQDLPFARWRRGLCRHRAGVRRAARGPQ